MLALLRKWFKRHVKFMYILRILTQEKVNATASAQLLAGNMWGLLRTSANVEDPEQVAAAKAKAKAKQEAGAGDGTGRATGRRRSSAKKGRRRSLAEELAQEDERPLTMEEMAVAYAVPVEDRKSGAAAAAGAAKQRRRSRSRSSAKVMDESTLAQHSSSGGEDDSTKPLQPGDPKEPKKVLTLRWLSLLPVAMKMYQHTTPTRHSTTESASTAVGPPRESQLLACRFLGQLGRLPAHFIRHWLVHRRESVHCGASVTAPLGHTCAALHLLTLSAHPPTLPPLPQATGADPDAESLPLFQVLGLIINVLFTIEFVLRLLCTPSLKSFVFNAFNIIDFFAIIPFYTGELGAATSRAFASPCSPPHALTHTHTNTPSLPLRLDPGLEFTHHACRSHAAYL